MSATQKTQFEETPENLAAEEAAFDAAFSGSDVTAPAPEKSATDSGTGEQGDPNPQEQQTDQQQQTDQADPATATAAEQAAKALTVDDLHAIIQEQAAIIAEQKTAQQQLRDQVFGRFGELKQKIDAVRGSAGGISPKARERLMNDFPELAEMLFEAPQEEPAATAAATATAAPAAAQPAQDGFTEQQRMEIRFLARDHKDWAQVVHSPEFATWKDTVLSPEDAAALDDTWDADFISAKITEFKAHRAEAAKKQQTTQVRQERLDAALTPSGRPQRFTSSQGEDEEEAAMMAAYKPR